MKKLLIISLFLFPSFYLQAQVENINKTDVQKEELLGKVKQLKQGEYEPIDQFGEIVQGSHMGDINRNYVKKFNLKGNLTEENKYNNDGSLYEKNIYKCDVNGNKISVNTYDINSILCGNGIYNYDLKGNLIEDKSITKHYDKNGLGSESNGYMTYIYDDKGRITEENYFDYYKNTINIKKTYEYNEKGNIIKKTTSFVEQNPPSINKYSYKYDDKSKMVEQKDEINNNYFTFKYDDNGNEIEVVSFNENNIQYKKVTYKYEYDNKKSIISKIQYNNDGVQVSKESYEYKYDTSDNWIKKINFYDDIPQYIIIRDIEYYSE